MKYTFSKDDKKFTKYIPTLSHLELVINNFHTNFTQGQKSDMINKIASMYNTLLSYRMNG